MTDCDTTSFGMLLKTFRQRQRLTQQELAEAIGIHRRTLVRWEQGDYLPESKALVLELARHLKLDDQETRQLLEASLTALEPHWLVPLPRNPFFTGREEVLEALHTQLGARQAIALTQSSALHGLGGVGKTQIALEYAYRHALEYSAVFWIGAETDEQVVSSLLHMAETLQLPEREDKEQQRVVAAVQRWLSTHGQWLLIWDNVENLDLLHRFLPSTRSGAILLTTRSPVLGTFAQGLDLAPMEQEEGMLFLLRRAKVVEPETTTEDLPQVVARIPAPYAAAAELVTVLGGLPLALDQAGAYVEETHCGLPAYLNRFHNRRAVLLQQRGKSTRDHPASVSTTFRLSITAAAQQHPAVWDLLQVCALLQPDGIPEELFLQGGEHLGPPLEVACSDLLEWDRVVSIACSYSLLTRQSEEHTLSIHRLVQAVLLDGMTGTEQTQWNERTIRALNAVFLEVLDESEYLAWKQRGQLLPHVLACLSRVGVVEESPTLASLAFKAGQYLRMSGQYAEAKPLYQRALSIREQALGSEHPDVATSLNYLAALYWHQGKYTEADPLYKRALSIREQTLGPNHPDVARSLGNLAALYWEQGKYTEAEPLYQRALFINEQALGSDHPLVAQALGNLGVLRFGQRRYTEAEPFYQRALHISEQALGSEHPLVAQILNNLAELYRHQHRYGEAESLYQRALSIREQQLGLHHPRTAQTLHDVATFYQQQSHLSEALSFYRRTGAPNLYAYENRCSLVRGHALLSR